MQLSRQPKLTSLAVWNRIDGYDIVLRIQLEVRYSVKGGTGSCGRNQENEDFRGKLRDLKDASGAVQDCAALLTLRDFH